MITTCQLTKKNVRIELRQKDVNKVSRVSLGKSKIIFLNCCQPALILSVREVRLDIIYALMFIFLKVTAVQSKDVARV